MSTEEEMRVVGEISPNKEIVAAIPETLLTNSPDTIAQAMIQRVKINWVTRGEAKAYALLLNSEEWTHIAAGPALNVQSEAAAHEGEQVTWLRDKIAELKPALGEATAPSSPINWESEYGKLFQQGCFVVRLLKDERGEDALKVLESALNAETSPANAGADAYAIAQKPMTAAGKDAPLEAGTTADVRLQQEVQQLRADAARYQFLRTKGFRFCDVGLSSDLDGDDTVQMKMTFAVKEPKGMAYEDEEWSLEDLDKALDHAIECAKAKQPENTQRSAT